MNYLEKRQQATKLLNQLRVWILDAFVDDYSLCELANSNHLIRYIWQKHGDYIKAESILRIARIVRLDYPEFDTRHNAENRANAEVTYREFVKI